MIVCKFGGTSVASKNGASKIKEIISTNGNRKIVIVSALGKDETHSIKITDLLIRLYVNIKNKEVVDEILGEIFYRYSELSVCLNVHIDWNFHKNILKKHMLSGNITKDYISSRGEYYSSILYAKYLGLEFIDAKDVIKFKKNRTINYQKTKKALKNMIKPNKKYVIGGFYGSDSSGNVVTFDRGGSDITGAIIAKLLNAEIYENYTDVDGVYDRNPNIFYKAKKLPLLNYKTAIFMADAGNEIVHKMALSELKQTNTLLIVKSTKCYDNLGTLVVDNNVSLKNIFICVNNCYCLIIKKLTSVDINFLKQKAYLIKIIKLNDFYYVLLKDIYTNEECLKQNIKYIDLRKCKALTVLSNNKIEQKNEIKLKKILKKIKKHIIFAEFISYFNNCLIVFDESKMNIVKQSLDII